jgi:glycosyltransferase involved in cell wall biosynthesis
LLKDNRYNLIIAGKGPLEKEVVEAAKNDSRITYYGYLTYEEVLDLYRTADVLINLRLSKTINTKYLFPSKIMEYLASGVPVITTCIGHTEEELADFVFLLKEESPQSVADMIEFVASMDPKNRKEIGERAQHYMFTKKTWDNQGGRITKFMMENLFKFGGKKA